MRVEAGGQTKGSTHASRFGRSKAARAWFMTSISCACVLTTAGAAAQTYQDVAEQAGLAFETPVTVSIPGFGLFEAITAVELGGGVGIGDFDDDGDPDLFFAGPGSTPNRLLRNDGGVFVDITPEAMRDTGHARVAAFVDLDEDRDLDLVILADHYVNDESASRLFRNDGEAWIDMTEGSGFDVPAFPHAGMALYDYDADGIVDILVTAWLGVGPGFPPVFASRNRLFRGLGGFRFEERTGVFEAGFTDVDRFTPIFVNVDDDPDAELFISVDEDRDEFYDATAEGYRRVANAWGAEHPANGMGVAVGDADGDGDVDFFVSNIVDDGAQFGMTGDHSFYENRGGVATPSFVDRAEELGVAVNGWAWGTLFSDPDLDGDLDLQVVNGFDIFLERAGAIGSPIYGASNHLFVNEGDLRFRNELDEAWNAVHDSRALAALDYDGDGDDDYFITSMTDPSRLLRNDGENGRPVRVLLAPGAAAFGATLRARVGGATLRRDIVPSQSFLVVGEPLAVFGLGGAERLDSLEITWRDGAVSTIAPVAGGQLIEVRRCDDEEACVDCAGARCTVRTLQQYASYVAIPTDPGPAGGGCGCAAVSPPAPPLGLAWILCACVVVIGVRRTRTFGWR